MVEIEDITDETKPNSSSVENQGSEEPQSSEKQTETRFPEVEESSDKQTETRVPEVEVHLYKRGKGPNDVFKSSLGGWDQDRLEVHDILEKYSLKSIYAFNPSSGRGVPIRFNPKNGRSLLPYRDGAVVFIDGEPKDPLIKPITKMLFGVAAITLLISIFVRETPSWLQNPSFLGVTFPPWILACMVIVFTRLKKRTRGLLQKYGW
ncbi:hypothetical protein AMTRI_Chr05g65140 [Amborella trichopoda]|uniref:uncharacterized protein LOC105420474 n=1 Tax=Amborella trichopoda TaxID=13333 RepID=UPI0005D401D0|nr:uncharacterized protein LOC105420474 [Amborella trichopoda]|eukprot:XP_011622519.1 uncharacterized protein LOC105420474 [Amborella trichopoda]